MRDIGHLVVKYHDRIVGELAETKDGFVELILEARGAMMLA